MKQPIEQRRGFINIKIETFQPDAERVSRITNRECQSFTIDEFLAKHNGEIYKNIQDMVTKTVKELNDPTPKTPMV